MNQKIKDIIRQMSIEEKIAQLSSVFVDDLIENNDFSESKAEKILKFGIGQITRVTGSGLGLSPRQAAKIINKIQKFLVEKTRLGVPAIVHEECLAGVMGSSIVMFPMPLAMASTWEPELIEKIGEKIREQALSIGVRQCLSPVLDLCRDPRWGRCEETFGEDPYLVASMGVAYIKGIQGFDKIHLIATAKHFAAQGIHEGGRNTAPVNIGVRELRNTYLYPFEAAVKIANVMAIMPAYHEIDGVPCHANDELLTKILRWEWGFRGITVSDYFAVKFLHTIHRVAKNCREAAILAISAGVDVELPNIECFKELVDAVRDGEIPVSIIDRAVERVLYVKYLLGLFDNPYVEESRVPELIDGPSYRALAREVARKSIILLKNEGILPLPKHGLRIAVVGPLADSVWAMLGDYHYFNHVGLRKPDIHIVTVLEGIRNSVGSSNVVYAKGCELTTLNPDMLREAVEVARSSDVVIAVVGDISCLFDRSKCTSGEGVDRSDLHLPKAQEDLIKAVASTGKPIVLVILAGRPMSIESIIGDVRAVLWAWKLGAEGGTAIADILFGDAVPSGRLPVSLPRSSGQIPIYYSRKHSSFGDYLELSSQPLYPFGYGLSYSEFRYSNFAVETTEVPLNGEIKVSLEVENIGRFEAEEVVQLYISRLYSSITAPIRELKAFKKVSLKPGEKKKLTFIVPTELLAIYNKDLKLVVEPGEYKVIIGRHANDTAFEAIVRLVGSKPLEIGSRRVFASQAYVE